MSVDSKAPVRNISGYTSRGELVRTFHIRSKDGMTASISTLGARLLDLCLPDGTPMVLTLRSVEEMENDTAFVNAIVGRVANRISAGRVTAYQGFEDIQLPLNESKTNTLHGGLLSWDRRLFSVDSKTSSSITLSMLSPDGDNGFPSQVSVSVCYEFSASDELSVTLSTTNVGSRTTITNMTVSFELPSNEFHVLVSKTSTHIP